MKINIDDFTEAYPVHQVYEGNDGWANCFDVDLETLKRWKKISKDFMDFQVELYHILNARENGDLVDWWGWNPMPIDLEDGEKNNER